MFRFPEPVGLDTAAEVEQLCEGLPQSAAYISTSSMHRSTNGLLLK
jgi:hypothetical protein